LMVETRSQIDVTQTPSTVLVAGSVVRSIQADPRRLLTGRIAITSVEQGEAAATLQPMPGFNLARLTRMNSLQDLQLPTGQTLYASLGGGADVWLAAMLAWLRGDKGAPVVSVRGGIAVPPTLAEQIAPNVYKISEGSTLPGKRQFEDLVARIGMESYLIMHSGRSLEQEFRAVADHAGVTAAIGVDTGGDALQQSTLGEGAPSRDHQSLEAISQLGLVTSKTVVFGPGIDAPDTLGQQLELAQAQVLPLLPLAEAILSLCAANRLPTDDEKRFSHTLPIFLNALRGVDGLEEIPTPTANALLRKRPWVPFGAANELMRHALFMDVAAHREAIGMR
jgi:hypothetical protein